MTFLDEGDEALVIATPSFFMYDVSVSMMTLGQLNARCRRMRRSSFRMRGTMQAITPNGRS